MRLPLATAVMTVFVTASVSSSCSGYPPIREALSNSWAGLSVERRSKLSPVVFHGLAVETYPPVTDKAPSVGFYYSAQFWLISVYKAARELAAFFGTGPPVNGVYDIRDRRVNVTGFYRPNATATPHCWVPVTSQKYYVIFAELVNGELTAKDDATRGATADWTELNEGRVWKGAGYTGKVHGKTLKIESSFTEWGWDQAKNFTLFAELRSKHTYIFIYSGYTQ